MHMNFMPCKFCTQLQTNFLISNCHFVEVLSFHLFLLHFRDGNLEFLKDVGELNRGSLLLVQITSNFTNFRHTMGQISSILWGPAWNPSRQVRIENGLIQGKTFDIGNDMKVDAYLGIPFAKPPIGPLRFKVSILYSEKFRTYRSFLQMINNHSCFRNQNRLRIGLASAIAQNLVHDVRTKTYQSKGLPYSTQKVKTVWF
jgi:hypothetical protein